MKKWMILLAVTVFLAAISCGGSSRKDEGALVSIKTEYGEIKIRLYDETPLHRDNFLKLTNEGFYDGMIFHRVIKNFMIQGGDPAAIDVKKGIELSQTKLNYMIPAEINPKFYHKRGAVAAARKGGPSNPEKKSSASQFYIVQGEVYRPGQLDTMIVLINKQRKDMLLRQNLEAQKARLSELREKNDRETFNKVVAEVVAETDSIYEADYRFSLTDEQKKVYTTIGGYPSLDGDYTVFGEVVEGMEVVDKIAAVETDANDRPKQNITMKVEQIK